MVMHRQLLAALRATPAQTLRMRHLDLYPVPLQIQLHISHAPRLRQAEYLPIQFDVAHEQAPLAGTCLSSTRRAPQETRKDLFFGFIADFRGRQSGS